VHNVGLGIQYCSHLCGVRCRALPPPLIDQERELLPACVRRRKPGWIQIDVEGQDRMPVCVKPGEALDGVGVRILLDVVGARGYDGCPPALSSDGTGALPAVSASASTESGWTIFQPGFLIFSMMNGGAEVITMPRTIAPT
jgi:hypothetical protein